MDSNRNISRSVIVKTLGPLSCAVKSGVLVSEAPHWPTLLAQFEHLFSPCLSYLLPLLVRPVSVVLSDFFYVFVGSSKSRRQRAEVYEELLTSFPLLFAFKRRGVISLLQGRENESATVAFRGDLLRGALPLSEASVSERSEPSLHSKQLSWTLSNHAA